MRFLFTSIRGQGHNVGNTILRQSRAYVVRRSYPIHIGHFDVHHHPVGLVRCIGLDRLKSVRRFHRFPIFVRKNLPYERTKFRVIVSDQNKG